MGNLKILVVSQHYWPETFRINIVVTNLRELGHDVEVLCGIPNYPEGAVFRGYKAWHAYTQTHPEGYRMHRVPEFPRGRSGPVRLFLNYISFATTSILFGPYLTRRASYDVVFVYGTSPILQGLTGALYRRLKGAAHVIWVQDLWPQSLRSTGYVKNETILSAVGALTRFIYGQADLLLAQSLGFKKSLEETMGGVPVAYHPNPGDPPLDDEAQGKAPSLILKPGFNVVFAGNLGSAQSLETVLDAAERLLVDPEIRIVLIGSGSRSDWLREEIARRNLGNVDLAGRFPAEAMPAILSQSSALLVTLTRAENFGLTVPSKIPTYLSAGKPIIAALDGDGAEVVRQAGAGLTVPAEDASGLAAAISAMKALSDEERSAMASAGRRYFDSHFAPDRLAQSLVGHFRHAIALRKGAPGDLSDEGESSNG